MKIRKMFWLTLFFMFITVSFVNIYGAAEFKEGIENFPVSYRPYLYALQEKHPKWKFTAMYTGLDWEASVKKESVLSNRMSVSLAPASWDRAWHYILSNGSTNRVEQGWVTASANAVRYTLDPRNFLNEKTIFQFEELTYNENIHTLTGVEQILYGTEMSKTVKDEETGKNKYVIKEIEYYQRVSGNGKLKTVYAVNLRKSASSSGEFIKTLAQGTVVTTLELNSATDITGTWSKVKLDDGTEGYICRVAADGEEYLVAAGEVTTQYVKYLYDKDGDGKAEETMTYAEAYMLAARETGVSPYALALRTKNETGCQISSNGQIAGKHSKYPGYYNYYSIGAYGANPMENGVIYAAGKNWDNPVKAIVEGAKFWGKEYILAHQNTPYLQKYNVNTATSNGLYSHQYMTDITCIYREALGMYNTYDSLGILNNDFTFIIPVYNNMPDISEDIYLRYDGYFQAETDDITTNKETAIYSLVPNVASGVHKVEMVTVPAGTQLTKVASGLASSYDKVKYEVDGSFIYGYIFYTSYNVSAVADSTRLKVVASPWVRLRTEPNTTSSQVCLLYTGDIVKRIEKNSAMNSTGTWDKVVTSDGKVGYVCRIYQDGADIYLKEESYTKVTGVNLEKEKYEVVANEKIALVSKVLPDNAKYKDVVYKSSDEKIATVDKNGVVTGLKAGTVIITVTTDDQIKTATCEITVQSGIYTDKEQYLIEFEKEITPEIKVVGLENSDFTIEIEDESVISLKEGKFVGIKVGTTSVTIKSVSDSNISKTIKAQVLPSISIDKEEYTAYVGEEIVPIVTIKGVENSKYIITTSDESIAKVVENKIETVKVGTTNITVKLETNELVSVEAKVVVNYVPGTEPKEEKLEVKLNEGLKIKDNVLTGVGIKISADKIKTMITTNGRITITDINNKELTTENVGTDSKIVIKKGEETVTYTVMIRGDVTGDGQINSADLLKVVKYLKGDSILNSGAADTTADGNVNSADLLRTVKYLKGDANIDFN
ncbi:MAG: SH3 domain-containing protein [Clostridia bacterium]|nr:SH3 domain-containing protein [Clostridia bacterium]